MRQMNFIEATRAATLGKAIRLPQWGVGIYLINLGYLLVFHK